MRRISSKSSRQLCTNWLAFTPSTSVTTSSPSYRTIFTAFKASLISTVHSGPGLLPATASRNFCSNFSDLKSLDLSGNRIEEVPPSMRELSALVRLDLHNNCLHRCPTLTNCGQLKVSPVPKSHEFKKISKLRC